MVSITASWGSRKVFGIALFLAVYSFFLHVNLKFFDKDLVFDDRLGDAVTDADGEFYILPKLLEGVSKGERITITKHGVPVAILQPFDPMKTIDTGFIITELRRFREKNTLAGLSIREMIEEGRQ
jgi:antitoxin (DNA-binding transcriptional repressor) of toxin-antitoxin stability system